MTSKWKLTLAIAAAAFVAALSGCSSSDSGKVTELERQLDMAEAAKMTAEQERDAAKMAEDAAKQAQADAEAAKAEADRLRMEAEAAKMTAEQERDAAKMAEDAAKQAQADAETAEAEADRLRTEAEAAKMTAEQERDAAKMGEDAAKQAQADAETDKAEADRLRMEAETARMTAEQERDAAKTAEDAAKQTQADAQFNAAVANAMEKVVAWDLRREFDSEDGRLHGTTAWLNTQEADSYATASEFAVLSQTHKYGDQIHMAVPWRNENGELQFSLISTPEQGSLHNEVGIYTWRYMDTNQEDRGGVATSSGPVTAHGLGSAWQGFDLKRAYDGAGTWQIRLFADFEDSDALAEPSREISGLDNYQILVTDHRVPGTPADRDGLHVGIPGDGLRGSLDGADGTFSCDGFYCALETHDFVADGDLSRYAPWIGSGAIRFTPADASQPEVVLDGLQYVNPDTEIPKVDYLAFGSWMFLPEDDTNIEAYEFGVFAGGDDPFTAVNIQALAGTASYAGRAAGTYAETIDPHTESFTADVALTADFGSESDLGRVTGEVSNFMLESGTPAPLSTLRLQPDIWRGPDALNIQSAWDDGNPIPGGYIRGDTIADGGWWGAWGGRFFGNGSAATDLPTGFAGTFGATDGTRHVAGSFGAHQQP